MLDKIPFLHGCEDDEDDSDEEDDFQGMATDCIDGPRKNKKSRAKVGSKMRMTTVMTNINLQTQFLTSQMFNCALCSVLASRWVQSP